MFTVRVTVLSSKSREWRGFSINSKLCVDRYFFKQYINVRESVIEQMTNLHIFVRITERQAGRGKVNQ